MSEDKGRTIKGKAKADVTRLVVKSNQKADGHSATLDIGISRTEKQCASLFGDDFKRLAFGQMIQIEVEDGTEFAHLASSITAGKRFKLAKHIITLGGLEVTAKPTIKKIVPIDKSDRVTVEMGLEIYVGMGDGGDDLGGALVKMVGDTVDATFSPAQLDLPGTQ